jgi:mannose-6-phosphate isomerase
MTNLCYPLTFTPVFRDYIWGGRNLETKLGRQIPPGIVAESWEISGHPSSPTLVDNGSLAGKTLPELMELFGLDLVGSRSQAMLAHGKFPLLVKLLDANQPLSVQVHPDDDYARRHENGELGKTEMWYILHSDPGAYLIYGLKTKVTPADFRRSLEAGHLETYLHQLPVKTGDAVFIPAGSLHAIMSGILLAEIQQNSDTTYRVYDWNRLGVDGKPRPLHVDKALEVINFEQIEPGVYLPELLEENTTFRREMITTCPYFNVERITFTEGNCTFSGQCDGSTFEIWGVMSGCGQIIWANDLLELPAIRFTLLPANLGEFQIRVTTPATWLRVYVPA